MFIGPLPSNQLERAEVEGLVIHRTAELVVPKRFRLRFADRLVLGPVLALTVRALLKPDIKGSNLCSVT
jgi:hypothetical protein